MKIDLKFLTRLQEYDKFHIDVFEGVIPHTKVCAINQQHDIKSGLSIKNETHIRLKAYMSFLYWEKHILI